MEQGNEIHLIPTSKIKIRKVRRKASKNGKTPIVEKKENEDENIEQRIEKIGEMLSKTNHFYIPKSNTRKRFKGDSENRAMSRDREDSMLENKEKREGHTSSNSNITEGNEIILPALNITNKDDVNETLEKVKLRSRSIIK